MLDWRRTRDRCGHWCAYAHLSALFPIYDGRGSYTLSLLFIIRFSVAIDHIFGRLVNLVFVFLVK